LVNINAKKRPTHFALLRSARCINNFSNIEANKPCATNLQMNRVFDTQGQMYSKIENSYMSIMLLTTTLEGYLYDCTAKRQALKQAISVFGEGAARLLISQLEDKYKLRINGSPCSALYDIEAALVDIAGSSSDLIITRIHAFLCESHAKSGISNAN
jgi:hypothetical protein